MMLIETIWQGPAALGEGPLWVAAEKALYWVDIVEKRLYKKSLVSDNFSSIAKAKHWDMPDYIGCIARRADGSFIAGIGDEICSVNLTNGKITKLVKTSDGNRLNDGKLDSSGRFWVGSASPTKPQAKLYRFDPDGGLHVMEHDIYISNGLAWSLDDRYFYYTDSVRRTIYRYEFDKISGKIANRINFAEVATKNGFPDGLTIDANGFIWSANWDGGCLTRYAKDGRVDRVVQLPVQRPTSCAFGGAQLDRLFVTSASRDIGEKYQLPPPAGGVLMLSNLGVTGV